MDKSFLNTSIPLKLKMPSSVLVIDDSDKFRERILCTLMDAGLFDNCLEAKDGIEGFRVILNAKPDLIISGLDIPRRDGFKLLQKVRARQELQDTPFIILTGNSNKESIVRALEQGANDYITEPFDAGELAARVKVQLKIKRLQDELRSSNEHFKELSIKDPLTNIYNRRYFSDILDREFQRAERKREFLSLVIFDVDHFKKVNDLYGHHNGDTVLVAIVEAAQKGLRTYDVAARYGGEEFVFVLPGTPLPGGVFVAERLREAIQSLTFAPPMDGLSVTVSVGVATYPSPLVVSVTTLFHEADYALYRAKQNGRNRVEAADTNPSTTPVNYSEIDHPLVIKHSEDSTLSA